MKHRNRIAAGHTGSAAAFRGVHFAGWCLLVALVSFVATDSRGLVARADDPTGTTELIESAGRALRGDADPAQPTPQLDPAEVLSQALAEMRSAGELLERGDAGAETRKLQEEVLRRLDQLLKQAQTPPPPTGSPPPLGGSSGGGSGSGKGQASDNSSAGQSGGGANQSSGASGQPGSSTAGGQASAGGATGQRGQRGGRRSAQRRGRAGQGAESGSESGAGESAGGPAGTRRGQPGGDPAEDGDTGSAGGPGDESGRERDDASESAERTGERPPNERDEELADQKLQLELDVWGHLPPKLREQLLNTYGEKMLPQYEQQIREYYQALAKSRANR
jgi:hypothetical protein